MKKEFKFNLIVFMGILVFSLTGCHNMCDDLESVIGKTEWTEKLHWVDASQSSSISSGASTKFSSSLEADGYVIKTTGSSGNWLFSGLGSNIKGFEGQVKLEDSTVTQAGFQIFATDSYKEYFVAIKKDGSVNVYYDNGKIDSTPEYFTGKTKVVDNVKEYNTIKVELLSNRSTRVSVNGKTVCTIPDHSLHYGKIATIFGGSGTCYFKIKSVQK